MGKQSDDQHNSAIDPDALARAEAVIEQLRWTYIRDWAPVAMDELEAAARNLNDPAKVTANGTDGDCEAILRLTHDMKGQAGTFGLELLQDFAASLHDFVRDAPEFGTREASVVQMHTTAMRAVLSDVSAHPDGLLTARLERELRESLRTLARLSFN